MFVSSGYPSGTTTRTVAGPLQVVPVTTLPVGGCTTRLSPTVTTVQPGQQLLTKAGSAVPAVTLARSPSTGGLTHQVTTAATCIVSAAMPSPTGTVATPRTVFTHRKTRSEGGAAIQTPMRHLVAEASPVVSPSKGAAVAAATAPPTAEQHTVVGIRTTKDGQKATLGGKTYSLKGVLGKGSFGVVYSGKEEVADCEGREVAVKEIRCKSLKECQQAEYEATLLQKVTKENNECGKSASSSVSRRIACPAWLASQKVATGPSQWTVLIAMEKVAGTPLDEFAKEVSNRRPYSEAVELSRQLLEQLCPAMQKVSKLCVHRDINAHNILLTPASPPADPSAECSADKDTAMPASSKEARAGNGNVFTLIDFGLATDWTSWKAGDWKVRDIGGDCRYWPVSSWKLFLFGYKYLLGNQQWTDEYVHNLDAHTVVLTCIQLIAEVSNGAWPAHAEPVRAAWNQYWIDAMRFWKQLYSCFKGQGDWNALKSAFLQQQVAETTKRNLDKLRASLMSCAASSEEQSAFFTTLAGALAGKPVDWSEMEQLLDPKATAPVEEQKPPVSPLSPKAKKPEHTFHHRRSRTIGSSTTFTQDVPQVGAARLEADNAASAAASGASTTASENADNSTNEEEQLSPARMRSNYNPHFVKLVLPGHPAGEPGVEEDQSSVVELAPPRRNVKQPSLLRQITEEQMS